MQRAKLGKDGDFYTVEVDGVVVYHNLNQAICETQVNNLNESNDWCDIVLDIIGK